MGTDNKDDQFNALTFFPHGDLLSDDGKHAIIVQDSDDNRLITAITADGKLDGTRPDALQLACHNTPRTLDSGELAAAWDSFASPNNTPPRVASIQIADSKDAQFVPAAKQLYDIIQSFATISADPVLNKDYVVVVQPKSIPTALSNLCNADDIKTLYR